MMGLALVTPQKFSSYNDNQGLKVDDIFIREGIYKLVGDTKIITNTG